VFGNIQLTTQVMGFLLDRGIDTAFISLGGRLKGRLMPLDSKNVELRLRQFEMVRDQRFALRVARAIVAGKISNCCEVLSRYQRNHAECNVKSELAELAGAAEQSDEAQSVDSLRGVEGQAAAVYFRAFARLLRKGLAFSRRTRRPPTDPVNSLLSFGYSLLYNEAIGALAAVGVDPYLGFYHAVRYGRCSLALDLMEEMRPLVVDRLVLNLLNLEAIKAADFEPGQEGGVYLASQGRRRFLAEYERALTNEFTSRRKPEQASLRHALHDQALKMQRAIVEAKPYRPFVGWH
jgi:CRISP-associated protein Cas1